MANAKTLCCIVCGVSRCMLPCFHEPWSMCNLPLCVVPPFLVFGAITSPFTVFIWALQYNSLHSALVLQAKKRWMLRFTVKKSKWKNLYWLQYPICNKVVCKWRGNLFFARDVPTSSGGFRCGGPEARLKRGALWWRHHTQPTVISTFDQA